VGTLLGFRAVVEYPEGEPRRTGQVIAGKFVHAVSSAPASKLAQQIRHFYEGFAERAGIASVRVSFVKPIQLASQIDVIARRPQLGARDVSALISLRLEGFLLRVRSLDGKPFALRSFATRSSGGRRRQREHVVHVR
jgi:hypothetical protein